MEADSTTLAAFEFFLRSRGVAKVELRAGYVYVVHEVGLFTAGGSLSEALDNLEGIIGGVAAREAFDKAFP